jgi:hypothetical protein
VYYFNYNLDIAIRRLLFFSDHYQQQQQQQKQQPYAQILKQMTSYLKQIISY